MNTVRLAKVAMIKMGQSPPGETYNRSGDGMPFFQGKADFGDIYPTVRYWCSAPKTKAEPNDILMSVRAPVGSINLNRIKSSYGRGLAAIRPTDSIDLKYLYHFLNYHEPKLAELGRGSTFEAVNRDDVEDIEIPFPSLPKQKRIAALLDKADRLRRQRRFAQTLSDSFLQSVFIKMFGDPVANPMEWKMRRVGDELDVMQYGPRFYNELYSPTGIRIIRITDLDSSGELDFLNMPRLKVSDEDKETYAMKPGELIFARSGATVGKTALIPEKAPVCIAGAYFMTMRFKKAINPVFVRQLFAAKPIQSIIESRSRQSAQQNFSGPGLRELPLVVPPLPLQEKFAAIVQKFERIRRQQREATRQAEHLFQTLLHRAFRGRL